MRPPDPNHPLTDVDAPFSGTSPKDTYRVMAALRKAGVSFDVTVNPRKDIPEDQVYDIFWFRRGDDIEEIERIMKEAAARTTTGA